MENEKTKITGLTKEGKAAMIKIGEHWVAVDARCYKVTKGEPEVGKVCNFDAYFTDINMLGKYLKEEKIKLIWAAAPSLDAVLYQLLLNKGAING